MGSHLNQAGLGTQVLIVAQSLQVYLAGEDGIIGSGSQLHLKTEGQVILPVCLLYTSRCV